MPELRESPIRPAARALAVDIIGGPVVERFDMRSSLDDRLLDHGRWRARSR